MNKFLRATVSVLILNFMFMRGIAVCVTMSYKLQALYFKLVSVVLISNVPSAVASSSTSEVAADSSDCAITASGAMESRQR